MRVNCERPRHQEAAIVACPPLGALATELTMDPNSYDYSVKFRGRGLLCLNVQIKGNKVSAYSFARRPDGRPGPAELSGRISLGDEVVGVNGASLLDVPIPLRVKKLRDALINPSSSESSLFFKRPYAGTPATAKPTASRQAALVATRHRKRRNRAGRRLESSTTANLEYRYADDMSEELLRAAVHNTIRSGVTQVRVNTTTCRVDRAFHHFQLSNVAFIATGGLRV